MQVRVLITTPKGCAKQTEARLKKFILIGIKKPMSTYVNDNDSQLVWLIEGNAKDVFKLTQAVNRYFIVAKQVVSNNMAKRGIKLMTGATNDQMEQLKESFMNNTTVEVIKEATALELCQDDRSIFSKIKERIHR